MKIIQTSYLTDGQKERLLDIWNKEYPKELNYSNVNELEAFLANLANLTHILFEDKDQILGWYFDFDRENEKWFVMLFDSTVQRQGWGSKVLNFTKERESILNGWVIDHHESKKKNGKIYKSPLDFYLKNGFKQIADQRLELHNISAVKIRWVR